MKLKQFFFLTFAVLAVNVSLWAQSISPSTKYHFQEGTIVIDTPKRPAGQQYFAISALIFAAQDAAMALSAYCR